MRQTSKPQEFEQMASGYRLEIERMPSEVLDVGRGHLENMMVITESGVEVLNKVPFEEDML